VFGDNCVSCCGFSMDIKCKAVMCFHNGNVKEVDGVISFFKDILYKKALLFVNNIYLSTVLSVKSIHFGDG
jgi:hypothetical protein